MLDVSGSNKFSFSLVWDMKNDEWSTDRVWGENKTEMGEGDLPQWLVGLDNAATLVMTANTVILMLGMGAATYWKEVTGCPYKQSLRPVAHININIMTKVNVQWTYLIHNYVFRHCNFTWDFITTKHENKILYTVYSYVI